MDMTEVKTAELIGKPLDWAVDVATASIFDLHPDRTKKMIESILSGRYSPSTEWAQGGVLIGRFGVEIMASPIEGEKYAAIAGSEEDCDWLRGDTHLIAAFRAIVAAKLGDVVSIPSELVNQ